MSGGEGGSGSLLPRSLGGRGEKNVSTMKHGFLTELEVRAGAAGWRARKHLVLRRKLVQAEQVAAGVAEARKQ